METETGGCSESGTMDWWQVIILEMGARLHVDPTDTRMLPVPPQ